MDSPATPQQREVNWSTLVPEKVLATILNSLSLQDRLPFRGVCASWRVAAKKFPCHHLPVRLMVRRPAREGQVAPTFGFFSIGGNNFNMDSEVSDAALSKFRCCGQHQGWLALVSDEDHEMMLLNPITDARISLPTCNGAPSRCSSGPKFAGGLLFDVKKVVLSASPTSPGNDCIVAAVGRCSYLALCRPGGDGWHTLDAARGGAVEDALFACGTKLFVLRADGGLVICDMRSYPRAAAASVVHPGVHLGVANDSIRLSRYLVESPSSPSSSSSSSSLGEIMVVSRQYAGYHHGVTAFHVVKLQASGGSASWVPVTNLGDRSLFVSTSKSECTTVGDRSDTCLRRNCIYFTRKVNSFATHGDVGEFSMDSMAMTRSIWIPVQYLQDHEGVWVKPTL